MKTIADLISEGIVSKDKADTYLLWYGAALNDVVNFSYTKKNGEKRYAKGTLNPKLVLDAISPDEREDILEQFDVKSLKFGEVNLFPSPTSQRHQHYFDVSSGAVRQFDPNTVVFPD